jgi:hypothetical protein
MTRTARGGGGASITIPTETCARIVETVANSMATSNVALMKVFICLSLPDPIVRTKGGDILGGAICDCERYSWPHEQVVITLRESGRDPGSFNSMSVGLSDKCVLKPRSRVELEVRSLLQLGALRLCLLQKRECPDRLLSSHLSCNLFAVQGMSLFSGLIRSTDMIGSLHMTWETSVAWKVKLPSFDEATSTRFLRCSCGIRIVCTDTSFAACKSRPFRRRLTCMTQRSGCLYSGSSRY